MDNHQSIGLETLVSPEFRRIETNDIELLRTYFTRWPSRSCDFSLGGVLMWREYFDYQIAIIENSLIIMGRDPENGTLIFYEPRGPLPLDDYKDLVRDYCYFRGENFRILLPEENTLENYDNELKDDGLYYSPWREYIYDAEKMATFAGRKMEKKRNHLNFFVNNYSPFDIETINADNIAELISFTLAFQINHNDSELADYECRQVIDVLRNYDAYGFDGIAVRKNDTIIGYAFGEKIGDTFFAHVEKGDIAYRGIYQLLASRMSRRAIGLYHDVKFINREEDMGDESLRQSKLSYHPSYVISKKIVQR